MVKLRCIRHADILKRAYLCQVSDTGSPSYLKELQTFSNTTGYKIVPLPVSGSLQFSNNISNISPLWEILREL